jgi:hypothetical protein
MSVEAQPTPRRRRISKQDERQRSLFDSSLVAADVDLARANKEVRLISLTDMPDYPIDLHAVVDSMLAELRDEPVLMTYRDIHNRLGVSRATIARRVKAGLVPGVRIKDGRVLEDGPVRRFDRTQVRWLLLAVRFGGLAR